MYAARTEERMKKKGSFFGGGDFSGEMHGPYTPFHQVDIRINEVSVRTSRRRERFPGVREDLVSRRKVNELKGG